MAMRVHRSSGNVFRDLGFSDDEAGNLRGAHVSFVIKQRRQVAEPLSGLRCQEDRRMRRTGRGGHPRNKR
jgi:hypothetical protein